MEKSINEIYDDLVDVLIEAYVFYAPREVVWQEMLDHLEGKIEDDFFDICHVVVNGKFGDADLTKFQSLQFEKVKRLEKNFFELLRLQRELSEQEFHILITKYLDYVEFLGSIAKWLLENLAKYRNPEDDLDVNSIFNVQWNQFAHHFFGVVWSFWREAQLCNYRDLYYPRIYGQVSARLCPEVYKFCGAIPISRRSKGLH